MAEEGLPKTLRKRSTRPSRATAKAPLRRAAANAITVAGIETLVPWPLRVHTPCAPRVPHAAIAHTA